MMWFLKRSNRTITINKVVDKSSVMITNKKYISLFNLFNNYFYVNVGRIIANNLKFKGHEQKSWKDLNNKCKIINSMFVLPFTCG